MMARVAGVMAASTASRSSVKKSSTSTNTGRAPACDMVSEVEIQLAAVVMTSCPAPTPSMRNAM
jgi:hypothetical protein